MCLEKLDAADQQIVIIQQIRVGKDFLVSPPDCDDILSSRILDITQLLGKVIDALSFCLCSRNPTLSLPWSRLDLSAWTLDDSLVWLSSDSFYAEV
jgi:hypothetical protein